MEINRYTILSIGDITCDVHSEFLLYSIQPGLLCHPTFVLDLFLHLAHNNIRMLSDNFRNFDVCFDECVANMGLVLLCRRGLYIYVLELCYL